MQFGTSKPLRCPDNAFRWAPKLLSAPTVCYRRSFTTPAHCSSHGSCTGCQTRRVYSNPLFTQSVSLSTFTPLQATNVKLTPQRPRFRYVQRTKNESVDQAKNEVRPSLWELKQSRQTLGETKALPMRFDDLINRAYSMHIPATASELSSQMSCTGGDEPIINQFGHKLEDEGIDPYVSFNQATGFKKYISSEDAATDSPRTPGSADRMQSTRRATSRDGSTSVAQEKRLNRIETPTTILEEELRWYALHDTGGSDVAGILKVLIQDRKVELRQEHFEALLLANCNTREGSAENVRRILQELQEAGFDINAATYTAALQALAVHPAPTLVAEILNTLHARWMPFTPIMSHMVIISMLRSQQIELANDALNALHQAHRSLPLSERDRIPLYLYMLLIRALVEQRDYEAVMRWIYRLHDRKASEMQIRGEFWDWLLRISARDGEGWVTGWLWQDWVERMRIWPSRRTCQNVLKIAARDGIPWLAESVKQVIEHGGTYESQRSDGSAQSRDDENISDDDMVEDTDEDEMQHCTKQDDTPITNSGHEEVAQEPTKDFGSQHKNITEVDSDHEHGPHLPRIITLPDDLAIKYMIKPTPQKESPTTKTIDADDSKDAEDTNSPSDNSTVLSAQELQWIEKAYETAERIERQKAMDEDRSRQDTVQVDDHDNEDIIGFGHSPRDEFHNVDDDDDDGAVGGTHNNIRDDGSSQYGVSNTAEDGSDTSTTSASSTTGTTTSQQRVRQIKPGNMWPFFKRVKGFGKLRFDPWGALGPKSRP